MDITRQKIIGGLLYWYIAKAVKEDSVAIVGSVQSALRVYKGVWELVPTRKIFKNRIWKQFKLIITARILLATT